MDSLWPFVPAGDGIYAKITKTNKYYCDSDLVGETLAKCPVYYEGYTYYYKENTFVRSPVKSKNEIIEMNRKFDLLHPLCMILEKSGSSNIIMVFLKDLHDILLDLPVKEHFDRVFEELRIKNVLSAIEDLENMSMRELVLSLQSLYEKIEFGYEIKE